MRWFDIRSLLINSSNVPIFCALQDQIPKWIKNTLLLLDDDAIDEQFAMFADGTNGKSMTDKAFVKALNHLGIVKDDEEVEEVMKRFDTDGNGEIDAGEFRSAVKSKSKMEMMLDDLPLIRGMASCLKKNSSSDASIPPIQAFLEMKRPDIRRALYDAVDCWMEILWMHRQRLHKAAAHHSESVQNSLTEQALPSGHKKFVFEIRGGSLEDFNKGIATRVGDCSANPIKGMEDEHTGPDADEIFTTSNYNITTTPRIEYNLAKTGGTYYSDLAMKTRDISRLSHLSEEEIKLVQEGGEARCGNGPARLLRPLSSYRHLEVTKKANLSEHEVMAIVLYTGPMYLCWNAALRQFPPDLHQRLENSGNKYSSSIHILSSAIKKIQQSGHALLQNTVLYRGLSGAKLPDEIFVPHQQTRRVGMTEFGVQSTTSDLNVAINYSGIHTGHVATVLAVKISQVDSGAYLGDFSQYPAEKEYLWASMSYLQAEGEGRIITTPKGQLVRVVPVRINTNGRTRTLTELQNQRKDHVCQTYDHIVRETARALEELKSNPLVVERARTDPTARPESCMDPYHKTTTEPSLQNTMMIKFIVENKLPDWFKYNVQTRREKWFNDDDGNYKSIISQTIDLKRLATGMVWYWVETENIDAFNVAFLSLEEAENRRIANLQAKLKPLREKARRKRRETGMSQMSSEIQPIARALCQLQGIVDSVAENNPQNQATLLRHAEQGNAEAVRLLVEAGVDVNGTKGADDGVTALMVAAKTGQTDIIELICMEYGADVHIMDNKKQIALMYASNNGNIASVKVLTKHQSNVYARDDKGRLSLMKAAAHGHLDLVRMFVKEHPRMLPARDQEGMSSLMHAAKHGQSHIVAYLLLECQDVPANKDHRGHTVFTHAAANGHIDTIMLLVNDTVDFVSDPSVVSGLHLAAHNGHRDVVQLLLGTYKMEVDVRDDDGRTAFMFAAENGHKELMACLSLEFGANVNATDNDGRTALLWAAYNGDKETVLLLALELNADVKMTDTNGMSAIDYARGRNESEVISLLEWL